MSRDKDSLNLRWMSRVKRKQDFEPMASSLLCRIMGKRMSKKERIPVEGQVV